MPEIQLHAHAAFVRGEERRDGLARGAFKDADEIRRAQHGGHPVRGEFDAMLQFDDECRLTGRADFGGGFHF